MTEFWVPGAAVRPQERGPDFLLHVDDMPWSDAEGFHRGFCSSFRLRPDRMMWFHFPFTLPVGVGRLTAVSLLWETLGDAQLAWMTVQHGGMERVALTERLAPIDSAAVPFEPAEADRPYFPASARRLTRIAVAPAPALMFGVQLSVMIRTTGEEGVVRFYGAGAEVSAD